MNLGEFRQKYPQYNDMSDQALSDALYQKYYSDLDREDFNKRIGFAPEEDTTLIGDLASGVATGFTTMVPLAVEGVGALAYSAGLTDDLDNAFVRWGRQSQKDIREFFGGDSQSTAYGVGNALGSFASFFIPGLGQAGLAAKGLGTAGKIVGYGGQGALAVGAGAGEQTERILNLVDQLEGEYPAATENLKAAIATGGVIGLTELAPVRFVTATVAKGIPSAVGKETTNKILARVAELASSTAPRRVAATGVGEGTQELLAGYLQDLTEQGLYNPDLEIGQSAAADFGYGGTAGAIFQTGLELMLGRRNRATPPPTNQQQAEEEQLAKEALDASPLGLPSPEPTLLLPDYTGRDVPLVEEGANVPNLVEEAVTTIGSDLPLSFNNGSVVTTDDAGTPDSYDVLSTEDGIFVASKQGTRVSPNFATLEQAAEFRDGLNVSVNEMVAAQDEAETQRQAREAVQRAKLEETSSTLDAARASVTSPAVEFGQLPSNYAQSINLRRSQTGRKPLAAEDTVSIEELSDNNVPQDVIDGFLPNFGVATADDVRSAAEAKNILVEDAGFERFARRSAGSANIDRMSPTQLGYMLSAVEDLPRLPGDTPQSLPVIQPPEFTGPQYNATISLAKRKGDEGILKSDVTKNIDMKRGAPTQSIIDAGVARGDLVPHPTKKNRWVSRQYYERSRNRTPLERGEQIEAEARAAEERAAQEAQRRQPTRETLGPGIIVETTREEGDTRTIPERSQEFKQRLSEATPTSEAVARREDMRQSLLDELGRFAASPLGKASKVDFSRISVEVVDSVIDPSGQRSEGVAIPDPNNGRIVIQIAADLAEVGAKSDAQVKSNLKSVFNHEVVHALRGLGVISDADMATLVKYAKNSRRKGLDKTFYEDAAGVYTEERLGYPPSQELLEEEAVADAFRYWAAGDIKVTGKPLGLFNRIIGFFKSVSSGLTKAEINSAEQIFDNLRAPIGARSAQVAPESREAARRAEAAAAEQGMEVPDAPIDAYDPKHSLLQLDRLAARIIGSDTVTDGNFTRRVRVADLPEYIQQRLKLTKEQKADVRRQKAAIDKKFALSRKPVDPKDPAFSAKASRHDDIQISGKRLAPRGKARRLSVLDLLYNDEFLPRTGNNVGYVARLLKARAKKALGKGVGEEGILIETDTSYDNLISDAFAAEALAALEETGNAADWYSKKVAEAVDTAAQLYPEIKTDPNARFAFLAALAVTSQNTPVMENSVYTTEVYDYFRENGRFPAYAKGKHGPSMQANFEMLNGLLDTMGPDGVRNLFETEFTVKQLQERGFNPPSGENVDTKVYGSFLMGPKIGQGFYQNLIGNFDPVTIDMWLMRSIGRVTGRLIGKPDIVQQQAERLLKGLDADPEKSRNNFLIASIRDAQIDGNVDALVEIADDLRREHDRIFKTPEVRALYEQDKYVKPEWAKAAEAIVTQQNKPQDSPSGGNFRNAVRRIMDKTRQKLADSGYNVTNADLQAILWYPEKNLYKKLGVRTKDNLNIDYAQAFERILQGGIELDAEGNVLQPVGRGRGAGRDDVAGRGEEVGGEISQANVEEEIRPSREQVDFVGDVIFEVAPDPNNVELSSRWNALPPEVKLSISDAVSKSVLPSVLEAAGADGSVSAQIGSYLDDTNPSFSMRLTSGDPAAVARAVGFVLSQDSMVALSADAFEGSFEAGAIRIQIGEKSLQEIDAIYQTLRGIEGFPQIGGQSTVDGQMTLILEEGVDPDSFASAVDTALSSEYDVKVTDVQAAFPENKDYDYASETNDPAGAEGVARQRYRAARDQASREVAAALDRYEQGVEGAKFSLSREQIVERESVERYNKQFGVPPEAYIAKSLSTVAPPSKVNRDGFHRIVVDGTPLVVAVPSGFDKFSERRNKTFGFGSRHMAKHNAKAAERTGGTYKSIPDLAAAALDAYYPVSDNPRAAGFDIKEQSGPFGATQIRMEWKNDSSGYPAILLFEPIHISTIQPEVLRTRPDLGNTKIALLMNGYVGASNGKNTSPIPQPAVNPKERPPEIQRAVEEGMAEAPNVAKRAATERRVLSLKKRYSMKRSEDNLSPDAKKIYRDRVASPPDQTFFERIMSSFKMSDPSERSVLLKIRRSIVDNYAGIRAMGDRAQEVAALNAEAHVNSAIGQLERKRGIVAAALRIGPLVRFGGQLTAINENIVENLENDAARAKFQTAFDRLQQRTQYVETDPVTGEQTVVRYESPADLKGLADIFSEIDQQNLWATFNLYAAAKRANRLMAEGREKTFTQEEIDLALAEGANNPAVIRAYRQYQLWNNGLIGAMQDAGVISEEAGQLWRDNSDYLPFYRQAYENEGAIYDIANPQETATGDIQFTPDMSSPNNTVFKNFYNIKPPKELKGGKPFYFVMVNNVSDTQSYTDAQAAEARLKELRKLNPNARVTIAKSNQRIESPTDNILRNLDAAVTAMTSNVVASRAVRDLQRLGLAQRIPTPSTADPSPDIVGILINGETKYYRVQDELLLATLGATGEFQMPGLDLMAMPAKFLREMITRDPGFMAANMMRDSLSAWATSGVTDIPGPGTFAGFVKTVTRNPSAEALEAAGVVGGYDAKQDKEAAKLFRKINRQQKRGGLNPLAWWDKWDKLSLASDTATRVSVFNKVLEKTNGNIAAANTEGLDVINFSRKGSDPRLRFFTAVVPFLNARIQGLDVLYRSAIRGSVGTESTMTKAQRRRRFYFRALAMVAMSTAYTMASMDDEDNKWYKNATEVDRDNHWIIPPTWFGLDATTDTPAFKSPIPFEFGVLFKVIPERIVRTIRGDTGVEGNLNAAMRHIMGTFAINPVPQFMLPLLEARVNYDFFTGRPVVTYWDGRNESWLADRDFVSPLAIETSQKIWNTFNFRVDAERIDHVVRGYTGTLGSYALMAADGVMRSAAGMPERPTRRLDQYPVLSRFLQENQGTGPVQSFYDTYNEVINFTNTISSLEKQGRLEEIDEYIAKRQNVALEADYIKDLANSLKELRNYRKQVSSDPVMGADDKAAALKEIQTRMNELVSEINKDKERIIRRTD